MKKSNVLFAVASVVFALVLMSSPRTWSESGSPKTIKLGVTASMSGGAAAWGLTVDRGIGLAIREINDAGGVTVAGQKYLLEKQTYDHAYNPTRSLEATKRLFELDKANFLLTMGTTATMPVLPYLEKNKIVTLCASAGKAVAYLDGKPLKYVHGLLTACPPISPYVFYPYMRKKFPDVKTLVTINADDESGHTAADNMVEVATKSGFKIAALEFYKRGTVDFYPILTRLLAKNPDVFDVMNCPPGDQGRMIKQARELGFDKGIWGTATTWQPQLDIAGKAAEGFIFTIEGVYPKDPNAPQELKDHYNRWVSAYGEASYDTFGTVMSVATHFLMRALQNAGTFDPDAVMKELDRGEETIYGIKHRFGGEKAFGYKYILIKPMSVMQIVDGKPTVLGTAVYAPES